MKAYRNAKGDVVTLPELVEIVEYETAVTIAKAKGIEDIAKGEGFESDSERDAAYLELAESITKIDSISRLIGALMGEDVITMLDGDKVGTEIIDISEEESDADEAD